MGTTVTSTGITFNDGTSQSTASTGFPTGTVMLFVQSSAPTGWTKSTTHNDKALRVVSGSVSSGGSVAFSTAFASKSVTGTVGATTLSTTQMPSHSHSTMVGSGGGTLGSGISALEIYVANIWSGSVGYAPTNAQGGGGSHTHSFTGTAINMAVQYVDVIICTKD